MEHFRLFSPGDGWTGWDKPMAERPLTAAEFQDSFDDAPGEKIQVWSDKPGRLAWPLALLIIIGLSAGLWTAIIFSVKFIFG